jgi:hypothetical protein
MKIELIQRFTILFGKPRLNDGPYIGYLGLSISQPDEQGGSFVHQKAYLETLLEREKVSGTVVTPCTSDIFDLDNSSPNVNVTQYLSSLGGASWMRATRPDCVLALSVLATRSQKPTEADMRKLRHLYKYLNGTRHAGLYFKPKDIKIIVFVDSSFAVTDDYKGQTCYIIQIGTSNAPIIVRSVTQKQNVRSSTASELLALDECLTDLQSTCEILTFLYKSCLPAFVYQDNLSTCQFVNVGFTRNGRLRFMGIIANYIKDLIIRGVIRIVECPTRYMVADIGTKFIGGAQFRFLMETLLNLVNMPDRI